MHVVRTSVSGAHPDLELHHITAGRRANESRSHICIVLVEGAHVARALVVVDHLKQRQTVRMKAWRRPRMFTSTSMGCVWLLDEREGGGGGGAG